MPLSAATVGEGLGYLQIRSETTVLELESQVSSGSHNMAVPQKHQS